jgi:uncharacterized protein (TIGR02246 family)
MTADEHAIRDLVSTWMSASKAGDTAKVLSLMTDDVVFMVPGQEPFGKEEFAAASNAMQGMKIDGASEIVEVQVHGDWAFARSRLHVMMTPKDGESMTRSGYTLTLFRKAGGKWLLARDANLLGPPRKS